MSNIPINQEFNLRYIPEVPQDNGLAQAPGGMYVSAKLGLNQPLEIAAQVPGYFEYQTWKFMVPNNPDQGIQVLFVPLSADLQNAGVGALGFHNNSEAPGTGVTLGPASDYNIQVAAEVPGGIIVFIRPTGHMVGMDYYVGINQDTNQLEIKGFGIGTDTGLPGWFLRT